MKEILNYENGKYIVETDGLHIEVYRYGELWQDFTGSHLIVYMLDEIKELREEVRLLKNREPIAFALQHSNGLEFGSKYPIQRTYESAEQLAKSHFGNVKVVPLYIGE